MIETKRWNVDTNKEQNERMIIEAANELTSGGTVAFPTETVYGLGADATNEEAVAKIFKAKGRPQDNPLIAHVATKEQLMQLVNDVPAYVDKLIETFSPGPITYVLTSNGTSAANVTAGLSTVGVRIPSHPVALALLRACNTPIAAPSANLSGKPSPTTADHVWEDLAGRINGLVDGGPTGVGVESTVVDCTQDIPIILRPGGISKEELEEVVGTVMVDPALLHADSKEKPKAPGMKYRHYSPDVPMWLVEGGSARLQAVYDELVAEGKQVGILANRNTLEKLEVQQSISLGESLEDVAASLYDGLRKYKQGDVDIILCETYPQIGIGQAIMNRLKKAASRYVEE
ncbi:L-threonylcarbamoyladenylate synthase [Ornithinibacillus halotolerans]|uniref:Threonylcarbamoyl-AMP synthase n=1 Tax=Ornithinibacillus halotolerans TaxID=1274357 RepID=A0A916RPF1_9BACI|nr:L-threonylcarbamoyladenylate synthase [Ornithinibacillus halotolerans]GGA64218.1 threonylcarbamoyl-AMP synthase [Ornithinibacillus halotolerans]